MTDNTQTHTHIYKKKLLAQTAISSAPLSSKQLDYTVFKLISIVSAVTMSHATD